MEKAKGNFTTETQRHGEEINKCLAAGVPPAVKYPSGRERAPSTVDLLSQLVKYYA